MSTVARRELTAEAVREDIFAMGGVGSVLVVGAELRDVGKAIVFAEDQDGDRLLPALKLHVDPDRDGHAWEVF